MAPEIKWLAWSVVLGLVHVFFAALLATQQRGLLWNAGNRDGALPPLNAHAARADRASRNFLETFPFFAVLALGVVLAKVNNEHTAMGAQIYLWARVAYLPIYVIGIPYIRTLAWGASFWGMLQMLYALL